jgi:predicted O-methyltransferase YrrM
VADSVDAVLERLRRERSVVARTDGSIHNLDPVAIGAEEGEALARWVRDERAGRTLEVGLGYAVSTLYICGALVDSREPAARHVALDPYQTARFSGCGVQLLEDAGVRQLVDLVEEESQLALPRFVAERRRFDLAFVDGNHLFDGVFLDLVYLGRLVRPGGIVFVDDCQLPAVARAVSFVVKNLAWRGEDGSTADPDHHWLVLRTADAPVERSFDHFVDF